MVQCKFLEYGSFEDVRCVIATCYDKALKSPLLAPYFENVNLQSMINAQTKFVTSIMGGPASYSNKELQEFHSHLEITDDAFDEMLALMKASFQEYRVDDADVEMIETELMKRRRFIVSR